MISSIFDKRKPVNIIIIVIYLLLYVTISRYLLWHTEVSLATVLSDLRVAAMLLFTLFWVDFIDRKNSLSRNNTYVLLLFSLSFMLFPQLFADEVILLTHIFMLLAIRRILSLNSGSNVKQKIFDAALWISIAALLYSWAAVYFITLYMAIILYTKRSYKNWGVPGFAVLAVLILRYTWFIWFENGTWSSFHTLFTFKIQSAYLTYNPTNYFIPFVFLTFMGFIATFSYGIRAVKKRTLKQATGFLIIIALLTGVGMVLFFGNTHKTTLLFTVFPFSVLFANYLVRRKKKWIRELLLWIFLLAPIAILMLQLTAIQ